MHRSLPRKTGRNHRAWLLSYWDGDGHRLSVVPSGRVRLLSCGDELAESVIDCERAIELYGARAVEAAMGYIPGRDGKVGCCDDRARQIVPVMMPLTDDMEEVDDGVRRLELRALNHPGSDRYVEYWAHV